MVLGILGIMSDLSITLEALERARSQLSVSTYFDEDLFRREQELVFQHGPRYLAHELALPEVGDYYALPQESEGRMLVRAPDGGVELLSNVCRHRQAVMLRSDMIPRIPKTNVNPHPVAPRVDLYVAFGGRWRVAVGGWRGRCALLALVPTPHGVTPCARHAEPTILPRPVRALQPWPQFSGPVRRKRFSRLQSARGECVGMTTIPFYPSPTRWIAPTP